MGEARAQSTLLILPALAAFTDERARTVLTRKFIDGVARFAENWGGRTVVVMEPRSEPTNELDQVAMPPSDLPFELHVERFRGEQVRRHLASAAVVLCTLSSRLNGIFAMCREIGTPTVYVSENTLRTRLQQVCATTSNPIVRMRRFLWQWNQERRQRRAIRTASGIQCNGTPTFEQYRAISQKPLLFFDSRVTEDMLPDAAEIDQRLQHVLSGRPLRLAFSGRLIPIKGVAGLPIVAHELKRMRVPFEMTIFGGGEQEQTIRQSIQQRGLNDVVRLAGCVEFHTELMPTLKRHVDLFVCPHSQGDPSCTYLETLACGVPIVGYNNEALAGLLRHAEVGWSEPMNSPVALARRIAALHRTRRELAEQSRHALAFARRHCCESTFRARAEHLWECSGAGNSRSHVCNCEYAQSR